MSGHVTIVSSQLESKFFLRSRELVRLKISQVNKFITTELQFMFKCVAFSEGQKSVNTFGISGNSG